MSSTITQTATFALGCFWGPDEYFTKLPGVADVRVGYAGGTKDSPTYHDLGDHTETVEIDFDPAQISYEQLLDHFWEEHDPTQQFKTQYQSMILTNGPEQAATATASKVARQAQTKREIVTLIRPAERFWLAEEYHQKYLAKNR